MANLEKLENFLPRQMPTQEKRKPPVDPTRGRKVTSLLLFSTVLLSVAAWWTGSHQITPNETLTEQVTLSVSATSTPTIVRKTGEITDKFKSLTAGLRGAYGLYVYNLTTKQSYGVAEDDSFPSASIMKLPVILTLYQQAEAGKIDLETEYVLKAQDKMTGAGSLQYQPAGTKYTYRKLVELMGKQSDNTAFHVIRKLLGDELVQKTIDNLGMKNTSITDFVTSPADVALFFRKFYSGSLLTREHRDEIITYLTGTFDESRIPAGVPDGTKVAHKVGTDIGVMSDGGIVFGPKPYVVVLMTDKILESEAKEVLPKISLEIWNFELEN